MGAAGAACGGAQPMVTAVELHESRAQAPRHPDGVLLEPSPAVPRGEDRARARGVVALRAPLAAEAVREVIRAYVRGFVQKDADALQQLLTPDAVPLDLATRALRGRLQEVWANRLRTLDYSKLTGVEVAPMDRVERFEEGELGGPGMPPRPPEMRAGDVLVRVPIATPRVGADQLFPEVLVLLLRRDEGRFKIAGVGEENGN